MLAKVSQRYYYSKSIKTKPNIVRTPDDIYWKQADIVEMNNASLLAVCWDRFDASFYKSLKK